MNSQTHLDYYVRPIYYSYNKKKLRNFLLFFFFFTKNPSKARVRVCPISIFPTFFAWRESLLRPHTPSPLYFFALPIEMRESESLVRSRENWAIDRCFVEEIKEDVLCHGGDHGHSGFHRVQEARLRHHLLQATHCRYLGHCLHRLPHDLDTLNPMAEGAWFGVSRAMVRVKISPIPFWVSLFLIWSSLGVWLGWFGWPTRCSWKDLDYCW